MTFTLSPPLFLILSYLNSAIFGSAYHTIIKITSSFLYDILTVSLITPLFFVSFTIFSLYKFIADNKYLLEE